MRLSGVVRFVRAMAVLAGLASVVACPTPGDESGEGEGEGEGEIPGPVLASSCETNACAEGFVCVDLSAGEEAAACFARCSTEGAACSTALERAGTCERQPDVGELVCVATSVNLEGCGNGSNSRCDDDLVCASLQNLNVKTCVRACNPADPTTCLAATPGCGCRGDEVCTPFIVLASGDQICAPPAGPGAVCGIESNGDMHPCTNGRCLVQSAPFPGRCE
jgi:hypothetical protein